MNVLVCPLFPQSLHFLFPLFSKLLPTFTAPSLTLSLRSHLPLNIFPPLTPLSASKSLYHKARTINVAPLGSHWKSLQSHNSESAQCRDQDSVEAQGLYYFDLIFTIKYIHIYGVLPLLVIM